MPELPALPVYQCRLSDVDEETQVEFIALVDNPAIQKNFLAFKSNQARQKFSVDKKRKIIFGPAMLADTLIYRNDAVLGEYYTVFDKATVEQIVQKFFKNKLNQSFNVMHTDEKLDDVTIFQSFITDSEVGIKPPAGFEDTPEGSWFIGAKVESDETWKHVEDGTFKGFSIEGMFEMMPVKTQKLSKETVLKQIEKLLALVADE